MTNRNQQTTQKTSTTLPTDVWRYAFGVQPEHIHFDAYQTWSDQVVYVPIGVLASCHKGLGQLISTANGTQTLTTKMLLNIWTQESDAADAYIWLPKLQIHQKQGYVQDVLELICRIERGTFSQDDKIQWEYLQSNIAAGVRVGTKASDYFSGMFNQQKLIDLLQVHAQQCYFQGIIKSPHKMPSPAKKSLSL